MAGIVLSLSGKMLVPALVDRQIADVKAPPEKR